jgi:hypothetical protein
MNDFTKSNTNNTQDEKSLFNAEIIIISVFCFYLVAQYLL